MSLAGPFFSGKIPGIVADGMARLERIIAELLEQTPSEVRERLEVVLQRPGKRVRSTLLLLLARTGEKLPDPERAARAAASIELLHLASLVHDDVIDETEMRRGQPTAHTLWGNRIAVLVGDYALAKSLELLVGDEENRIPQAISRAAGELVSGEVLELLSAGKEIDRKQYEAIIAGKTAALLEATTVCGSLLAGHSAESVEECRQLGRHIGFGFQIVDDLLDFGVGAINLGKEKYTDLCNGVMTLPMILHYQIASPDAAAEMRRLREGVTGDPSLAEAIVRELHRSGAIAAAQKEAEEHFAEAERILSVLPPGESREMLLKIVSAIANRSH